MQFLGLDIGSSSVKLAILDGNSGSTLASTTHPASELDIHSPQSGFAEQDPDTWWQCVVAGLAQLKAKPGVDLAAIGAIGISYQMHGLVVVDKDHKPLRPAIIWCDSRAVELGERAGAALGDRYCFEHLLNTPGNFTAAKLRWVQQSEPQLYQKIHKAMLPGDYIALQLTGAATSTASGLSEATLWDFARRERASELLDYWQIDSALIPDLAPNIGHQGELRADVAASLGLKAGIPVSYRAGDQPNNAFSLNVLSPGEVAATAGTSGVVYAVTDRPAADKASRVNTFLHVNDTPAAARNGVLLCVNGTGRLYSWLKHLLASSGASPSYPELNRLAASAPIGSDGLHTYPFGNGAERLYQNRNLGGQFMDLDYNRHGLSHLMRSAQEGIVFALKQGFDVLGELGVAANVVRVGEGNLFLSDVFAQTFANATGAQVEVYATDGASGAARGAALGCGHYANAGEAFASLEKKREIAPSATDSDACKDAYERWRRGLLRLGVGA